MKNTKRSTRVQNGNRIIDGRYFMLCGRVWGKEAAEKDAKVLRERYEIVRILKTFTIVGDYSLWVHGYKGSPE